MTFDARREVKRSGPGLARVGLGLRFDFLDEVLARLEAESGALRDAAADEVGPVGVDFFEVAPENFMRRGGRLPEALARVAARRPLVAHGLTMSLGGTEAFDAAYFDELARFLERYAAPFHSDHLSFASRGGRHVHDLLPLPTTRAAAKHLAARVREASDRLGRPLVVENVTRYAVPSSPSLALDEAAFIGEVLERAGARLLLDVNNLYVNALNDLGVREREGPTAEAAVARAHAVLDALPLERVAAIHVAGFHDSARHGVFLDTHAAPAEPAVLGLLARALERTGPVPIAIEWDHQLPSYDALVAEVDRVRVVAEAALTNAAQRVSIATRHVVELSAAPRAVDVLEASELAELDEGELAELDEGELAELDASLAHVMRAATEVAPDAGRLGVYRDLVRSGLRGALRRNLALTAARLGERFDAEVDAWLDAELPTSPYLRDAAAEFVAVAAPRWRGDADVALRVAADLATHEVAVFASANAEPARLAARVALASPSPAPSLEARWPTGPSVRFARYAYRVHELDEASSSRLLEPADVRVLIYRDADDEVRVLELSPFAFEVATRLAAGARLGEAVVGSAVTLGEPLTPALTDAVADLLSSLASRGVLGEPERDEARP